MRLANERKESIFISVAAYHNDNVLYKVRLHPKLYIMNEFVCLMSDLTAETKNNVKNVMKISLV